MGKIIKGFFTLLFTLALSIIILAGASIAGTRRDWNRLQSLEEDGLTDDIRQNESKKDFESPFSQYEGGTLTLELDYEVELVGDDVYVSLLSNLPDEYELSAELTNIATVKRELGYESISASALTPDQMQEINDRTYTHREKGFVTRGVCKFFFPDPPTGQLDLSVTSPITGSQPPLVREMLGEHGINFTGPYVVYLEEVNDKSINYTTSFKISEGE